MDKYNPLDLLTHIDPSRCTYQEWLNVGMALHAEGCTADDWDRWSQQDHSRYHPGECHKKWRGFGSGSGTHITGGSLVALARQQGNMPVGARLAPPAPGRELSWDDTIRTDDLVILDKDFIQPQTIHEPTDWNPRRELITYLEALFDSTDRVSYVTETWEKEGRHMPKKGASDRTAGELIAALHRCTDISDVIGTVNEEAGAWIRFNPMDGKDVRNDNVTAFNYALVESDSQDIEKQYALMQELQLPIRILVHSGGKSLHAIVRVDAGSIEEYRSRVDYLYTVCRKNGLEIDGQNKNPSRLSRMPGVIRRGKKQYIVALDMGQPSFTAWKEYVESVNDDLPDFESMADYFDAPPPLADELIAGCLRQGHKMLLSGPSKAGKSLALMALTIAIAEGIPWMGMRCRQGRVLYINLELARASCWHRFKGIYETLHIAPKGLRNLDVWNLRGHSLPMDKLTPKLIRRALKNDYTAVIIDPIYKIITGDENSAEQMMLFCNQLDRLCTELDTAVIYCHHHSKGAQGGKRAIDRSSGSGVFGRDPDALLDMIELELSEAALRHLKDRAAWDEIVRQLDVRLPDWRDSFTAEDQRSHIALKLAAQLRLPPQDYADLCAGIERAEMLAAQKTAWRIEATLREFPKFPPIDVWLEYPLHRVDDTGILADLAADEQRPAWQKATKARKAHAAAKKDDGAVRFTEAVSAANMGEPPTLKELSDYLGISERTCRDKLKQYGFKMDSRTKLIMKASTLQT
ncbi:MAG: AAA family ATPase [Clostridia bacterium]|nr:AAA family ATPase [Clostridia bacterium]